MNLKLTFIDIQLEASSLKVGQNCLNILFVLLKGFAENQNVVHVCCNKEIQNIVF